MAWSFFVRGYRPPSGNAHRGVHWSRERRLKREAIDAVGLAAVLAGVPAATGRRAVKVRVLLGPGRRPYDDDNAGRKVLLDALVTLGLLVDDSERGLIGGAVVEQVSRPAKEREREWGTWVELRDEEAT